MRLPWASGMMVFGIVVLAATVAWPAPERDPLKPRVPANQMEAVKRLAPPLFKSAGAAPAAIVQEGKTLYARKGTCANCHGAGGKGDGPVGLMLDPGPRDLTNCAFQAQRTDGELFWSVKHGIPGTAMVPFAPGVVSEEETWKILAYIRSLCAKP